MRRFYLLSVCAALFGVLSATDVRAAYPFINVADTTTAAPSGTYTSFGNPSISGGTAAFLGFYGASNTGIFNGSGGALTTIVKNGDAAPVGTFDPFGFGDPAISGGITAFAGSYNNDGISTGIFTGSGGGLTTIVKDGDAAPGGYVFQYFSNPSISGGTTAFAGRYSVFVIAATGFRGVFNGNGGALTTIAKEFDPAPVGFLDSITSSGGAISGGTTAFGSRYNENAAKGIFSGNGGALTPIALMGAAAPIGTFSDFDDPSISDGTAAFLGYYNGGADYGVFTGDGGALTTIVKNGDAAPVGTFDDFGDPSISGTTTAFVGYYNGDADFGIFTGSGGTLTSIIKNGDSLFGGTVISLDLGRSSLDSSGNLAFQYALSNGRSGVAIVALPEPASLALLGAGAVLLLRRRRR